MTKLIRETAEPYAFAPEYFATVFLVPDPPADWPYRFAIVTAHDPEGRSAPADVNLRSQHELDELLRAEGIPSFVATGASPDLSHQESGRAFAVEDLSVAASISARFRQQAFFVVEDGVLFICTDASGKGWKVGRWNERVVRPRS